MDKEQRTQFYQQQAENLAVEIRRLRKRNTTFVIAELVSFALIIVSVVAYVSTDTGYTCLYLAVLMLMAYIVIRRQDVRNSDRTERLENTHRVYQKELAYLDKNFSVFGDGEDYVDPQHPYSFDLDVFGRDSLFNRVNRTITTGGSDWLASEFKNEQDDWSCQQISDKREAIRELAEAEPLRTRFLSYGQQSVINTDEVLKALQGIGKVRLPRWPQSLISWLVVCVAIVGLLLSVVLAGLGTIAAKIPIIWMVAQFCIVYVLHVRTLREADKAVNKIHQQLSKYIALILLIVHSDLKSKVNRDIVAELGGEGHGALTSFAELQRILDGLDRRGNQLGLFLTDAFACSDYFLVRRFLRWREHDLFRIEDWIKAVSHFDALVSMATFRYNEPSAIDAEIVESDKVIYEAESISHPFLGSQAVANDFNLSDGHYYIITGANMAGKSTFLRTIGVNYILAVCGMPVFAKRLKVSVFSLFSSMRTTDDLTHGISYFNAELIRLQQLIRYCKQNHHTLIILDEILKGTNSLDKLNGSRLFLQSISDLPVTGIVATHDLELSRMADCQSGRFHNFCFEIQLSDEITYTYHITEGVARNQNATYLLKNILQEQDLWRTEQV